MKGIRRKVININLDRGLVGEETLPMSWYQEYPGGYGLGMKYLQEDLKLKKPTLSDPVIIMTGPLAGYPIPLTARASIMFYENKTHSLVLSSIGGNFPAFLKLLGFDGIIISGKSQKPVRINLKSGNIGIIDADDVWSKDILETEKIVKADAHEISTLTIGPGGEHERPNAGVVVDAFINGGAGIGRAFGNKKLKLIAIEPSSELLLEGNPQDFLSWVYLYLGKNRETLRDGTINRSCFGCVKCCGVYHSQQDIIYVEKDFQLVKKILTKLSVENLFRFYEECLKQGLDFFLTARLIEGIVIDSNFPEVVGKLLSITKEFEAPLYDHSWDMAQLYVHGWYIDDVFENLNSVQDVICKEHLAAVKHFIPVCERWSMELEDMITLFSRITGVRYTEEQLLKIGENTIEQAMSFYLSLGYTNLNYKRNDYIRRCIPNQIVNNFSDYLNIRKWSKSGYPTLNR